MTYTTIDTLLELPPIDTALHSDDLLQEAIDYAENLIDDYCGTSFEYKAFSKTLDGNNRSAIYISVPFLRTISSCTIDGTAQTTASWKLYEDGYVVTESDTFTYTSPGRNVVIAGTAGYSSSAPDQIAWATKQIARDYVTSLTNGAMPSRALSETNQYGTFRLSVPSPVHPTGIPEVDRILNQYRVRPPVGLGV